MRRIDKTYNFLQIGMLAHQMHTRAGCILALKFCIFLSNVKLFKDSLVEIIDDVFDCYDLIINLFGGQCQII